MNEQEERDARGFNPREHLIQLKSKNGPQDYLPVQWRLVWFRLNCREGSIETELVHLDLNRETTAIAYEWNEEKRRSEKVTKYAAGWCMYKATVKDGKGGSATAHGSEGAADFGDYVEKAETKAVGRALAMLGFGTQFSPDLSEEHRIVDAPVSSPTPTPAPAPTPTHVPDAPAAQQNVAQGLADAPASDQQKESIKKLRVKLGMPLETRQLTYIQAKEELVSLSQTWNETQRKGRAS